MSTMRRAFAVLANGRAGREAVAYVAIVALASFTASAGLGFVVALFMAMEPLP